MENKNLLIIGASDFQLPAILKAKEMGLHVAVVDMNPQAVGIKYADKYYDYSTVDKNGVFLAAKDFKADGIITICTDMPMRALAYSCRRLNLIGPDEDTALLATDKEEMIKAFEKCKVPHPNFFVLTTEKIHTISQKLNYPLISKPIDNSGSRGIMLINSASELENSILYSSTYGRSGKVIVEEFMVGPEVSVEMIVLNGTVHVLQVTDKLTTGAPHFVEIGHSQPSSLDKKILDQIIKIAKEAAKSVGIVNGPAHAEIIVTSNGPKMVEIGARMGGGCITTHLVPLSTGIDMTRAAINLAIGNKVNITKMYDKGAAIRFIIPKKGVVTSITGYDEAKNIKGVEVIEIHCKIGDVLSNLENGTNRIGYVISQADSALEAIKVCEEALKRIKIEVKDE